MRLMKNDSLTAHEGESSQTNYGRINCRKKRLTRVTFTIKKGLTAAEVAYITRHYSWKCHIHTSIEKHNLIKYTWCQIFLC